MSLNSLGQSGTGLAADGNGNNQIDVGDYDVWQPHFGAKKGKKGVRNRFLTWEAWIEWL